MRPLGILRLDTRFPRIYGDAGNSATWPFPVRIRTVAGADPERVVRGRAEGLVDAFVEAGRALADEGVCGITTTCGFLCLHQKTIAEALPVPFASSSLLQFPLAAQLVAPRTVGILTIDRASLTPAHLAAAGIPADVAVASLAPDAHLSRVLLGGERALDPAAACADMLAAAEGLVARHPRIGAIVLECANMPPYASALAERFRVPVYDWYSLVSWLVGGLAPRAFIAATMGPLVASPERRRVAARAEAGVDGTAKNLAPPAS